MGLSAPEALGEGGPDLHYFLLGDERSSAEEAEAGLEAADVLAVRQWWLERQQVLVSAGENLTVQPVGCQRLGSKSAALWIAAAVLCLPLGSAERVG